MGGSLLTAPFTIPSLQRAYDAGDGVILGVSGKALLFEPGAAGNASGIVVREGGGSRHIVRLYEPGAARGLIEALNANIVGVHLQGSSAVRSYILGKFNVGGSAISGAKLEVVGNLANQPAASFLHNVATPTTPSVSITRLNAVGTPTKAEALLLLNDNASNFPLYITNSAAADILIIDASGQVGIGGAPAALLDVQGEFLLNGDLNHDGSNIGFYGTTPAAQSAAYTRNTAIVEDRTLLASASATILNNNNVLAAIIADLQSIGILA